MINLLSALPWWAFVVAAVSAGKVMRWIFAHFIATPDSEHQTLVEVSSPDDDFIGSRQGARNRLLKDSLLRPDKDEIVETWEEEDTVCVEMKDKKNGLRRFFYFYDSKLIE